MLTLQRQLGANLTLFPVDVIYGWHSCASVSLPMQIPKGSCYTSVVTLPNSAAML